MTSPPKPTADAQAIHTLYWFLLDSWNRRDARKMAGLFTLDGSIVGFDGSQMNGQAQIEEEIGRIFADHQTATYVGIVREVRFLTPSTALLRAEAGMLPTGQERIRPDLNTVQSLFAVKPDARWLIAHYQNTPAQFHGRPELVQQLTEELQRLVPGGI